MRPEATSPTDGTFLIRECCQEDCRFRYPAIFNSGEGKNCPRCNGPTSSAGEPFYGRGLEQPIRNDNGMVLEVLLDNLRSSYNVGSVFRTSDGAGVRHVHLCGITSTPNHRKVTKTALGADRTVPWSYYRNGVDAVAGLGEMGYSIWSLENRVLGQSVFDIKIDSAGPVVLVVGNELSGVDPGILEMSDRIVSLPMAGRKSSLNAVVAFGVAAYWLRYGIESALESFPIFHEPGSKTPRYR